MLKNRFPPPVLLSLVLAAVRTDAAIAQEFHEPPGFLEVEQIVCYEVKIRLRHDREGFDIRKFNRGRSYAISINEHLPDARAARAKLARILDEGMQLCKVVSHWFGTEAPKRLNIMIGSEVPVGIAQAALAAYAVEAKLPVYIVLVDEDAGFNETRRVYIGGLVDLGEEPMPPGEIRGLLKPGLTHEELAKLLPKQRGRP